MTTDATNSNAFVNLDIVDGDIVSINQTRKSPVAYSDFPDIFKSPDKPVVVATAAEEVARTALHNKVHDQASKSHLLVDDSAAIVEEHETGASSHLDVPLPSQQPSIDDDDESPGTKVPEKDSHPNSSNSSCLSYAATSPSPAITLREQVQAGGRSRRSDFPLVLSKVALLIIDVQNFCCESIGGPGYYHQEALPRILQNINRLMHAFRSLRDSSQLSSSVEMSQQEENRHQYQPRTQGCEVIHCLIQSKTKDGRDLSLDYKLSGPNFANPPVEGAPLDELFPKQVQPDLKSGKGDIVVSKTSCSVFNSTNLDYIWRNLNVEQVCVTGQLTDQCVESAVRDGADLGYFMTVVEDACAAQSMESHAKGLHGMAGFCRILSTSQVLKELHHDPAPQLQVANEKAVISSRSQKSELDEENRPNNAGTVAQTNTSESISKLAMNRTEHIDEEEDTTVRPLGKKISKQNFSLVRHDDEALNLALLRSLQHGSVSFLRYLSVDVFHNLMCHVAPVERLIQAGTLRLPMSTFSDNRDDCGCEGEEDNDDSKTLVIHPDLSTLHFLPQVPNTSTLLGTLCVQDDNLPSSRCARFQLARVVKTAAEETGIHFSVYAEIQVALHNVATGDPVDRYSSNASVINRLTSQGAFISELDGKLRAQQILVDAITAGNAPGQLSVVLGRQSPLAIADAVVLTQLTIRSVALDHSLKAVFLPHIHGGRIPGNGLNLFVGFEKMTEADDSCKLSAVGGSFVQGILEHLPALVGLTLYTNNSFRRAHNAVLVGNRIGWGKKSKEAALLVAKTPYSREFLVEYRLCDNTCNLHLALAGILASGLDGVSRRLSLEQAMDEDLQMPPSFLPESLAESIQSLSSDAWLIESVVPNISRAYLTFRRNTAERTATMSLADEIQDALENA